MLDQVGEEETEVGWLVVAETEELKGRIFFVYGKPLTAVPSFK